MSAARAAPVLFHAPRDLVPARRHVQHLPANPPSSSNGYIIKPSNVAKFAAQFSAHCCPEAPSALDGSIAEKLRKLGQADEQFLKKTGAACVPLVEDDGR